MYNVKIKLMHILIQLQMLALVPALALLSVRWAVKRSVSMVDNVSTQNVNAMDTSSEYTVKVCDNGGY